MKSLFYLFIGLLDHDASTIYVYILDNFKHIINGTKTLRNSKETKSSKVKTLDYFTE